jgi:hypothetical protein
MGGGLWTDPVQNLYPPAMFINLVERALAGPAREEARAASVLERWARTNQVSESEAQAAIGSRSGALWQRAMAQAKDESEGEFMDATDYVGLLAGWSLPIEWARQAIRGTPERIGPLPVTRMVKTLTAAAGIGGPAGVNIEAPIRRMLSLPDFDRFEEYRIDRMLGSMTADGALSPDVAEMAMIERKGPAFDEATRRVNLARFYGSYGNPLYWIGFPADSFPSGEQEQRSLAGRWSEAMVFYRGGDEGALQKFLEAYPQYEARLAVFDKPEERLRSFLVDELWIRYRELGSANKELVRAQLGEDFVQGFLDSDTRNTDAISVRTLAMWAQALGSKLPDVPETRYEMPEDYGVAAGGAAGPQDLRLVSPALDRAVTIYRETRNSDFPNWFALQSEYYTKPPGDARKAFLGRFPILEEYWRWNRKYKRDHPEVAAYLQRYDIVSGGEVVGSLGLADILANPILARNVAAYGVGVDLTGGARAELRRIWEEQGSPLGSMTEWLETFGLTSVGVP